MSAAAAAPVAIHKQLPPHEERWRAHFAARGFIRTPRGFQTVLESCKGAEATLAWYILQQTVGFPRDGERPEWIELKETTAAKIADCSTGHAGRVLKRLELIGLINAEQKGRSKRFRVNLETWDDAGLKKIAAKVPAVGPDFGDDDDDSEDDCAAASVEAEAPAAPAFRAPGDGSGVFVLMPTQDARPVELPQAISQVVYRGDGSLPITLQVNGDTLELTVGPQSEQPAKGYINVPFSAPNLSDCNNHVSELRDLREMLNAELRAELGPVEESWLKTIANEMGHASVADLRGRINARRKAVKAWGMVLNLARDVAKSAPPPSEPAASQDDSVVELSQAKRTIADPFADPQDVQLLRQLYPQLAHYRPTQNVVWQVVMDAARRIKDSAAQYKSNPAAMSAAKQRREQIRNQFPQIYAEVFGHA